MAVYYQPAGAAAGDFIPLFWQGDYHLFYLKDCRDPGQPGLPWWHLVTRDFVEFQELGEAIPRGAAEAQDANIFTGSALEAGGSFHIFYTGHNGTFPQAGRPAQAVMHATSPDLVHWSKDGAFPPLLAPEGYEPHDWRDPFVFWNEQAGEYWMLLGARKAQGPSRRRGCTALLASPDLARWEQREPLWAPDLYYMHECPDLFRWGEWWYLVYSTFSERMATHYRLSRSLEGPWLAPANDTFDGRAYYAAKTAGDGERRFIFGWLPTREGERDDGNWQWGGSLVVHELTQQADGALGVRAPASLLGLFTQRQRLQPRPVLGGWGISAWRLSGGAAGRHSALAVAPLPECCLVETTLAYAQGTAGCGLMLRASADLDEGYQLRLEPGWQRLVFDRWPRPGDQPHMIERPLPMQAGDPITLRVMVEGTCLVAYANDRVALSCRMYDHRGGELGLFASEGEVDFAGTVVKTRP